VWTITRAAQVAACSIIRHEHFGKSSSITAN